MDITQYGRYQINGQSAANIAPTEYRELLEIIQSIDASAPNLNAAFREAFDTRSVSLLDTCSPNGLLLCGRIRGEHVSNKFAYVTEADQNYAGVGKQSAPANGQQSTVTTQAETVV